MSNLYTTVVTGRPRAVARLSPSEISAVFYHNIFDYPLSFSELLKWRVGDGVVLKGKDKTILNRNGFYFLEGREGLIYKRLLKARISVKKIEIAKRAAKFLSRIPTVKLVAVTGSLAMNNSGADGDIDLLVITKTGTLWTTRLLCYFLVNLLGVPFRHAGRREESDRLCMNMWFDENYLAWPRGDQNIYTAHEISQVVPLVNKNKTYERFIWQNRWVKDFWPNALNVVGYQDRKALNIRSSKYRQTFLESLAFWVQYQYMRAKITREVVTKTRAIFHPNDWGKIVLSRLST